MIHRLLSAFFILAVSSSAVFADTGAVFETRLGISSYFRAIKPGAHRGQMDVPLALVAASADRVTARFVGSVPEPLSGEQLRAEVVRSLRGEGEADESLKAILAVARTEGGELLDAGSIKFPAVVLVRLESTPKTPGGQALDATLDDTWENALRASGKIREGKFTLLIVSLDVSR